MTKRKFRLRLKDLPPELQEQAVAQGASDRPPPRINKYNANPIDIGDLHFDSIAESRRYMELSLLADQGVIDSLVRQPSFELVPDFRDNEGVKVNGIRYTADFSYREVSTGITVVEDVKSPVTARNQAFRLRWRLLQYIMRERADVRLVTVDG